LAIAERPESHSARRAPPSTMDSGARDAGEGASGTAIGDRGSTGGPRDQSERQLCSRQATIAHGTVPEVQASRASRCKSVRTSGAPTWACPLVRCSRLSPSLKPSRTSLDGRSVGALQSRAACEAKGRAWPRTQITNRILLTDAAAATDASPPVARHRATRGDLCGYSPAVPYAGGHPKIV
jgi:hypothetical protein